MTSDMLSQEEIDALLKGNLDDLDSSGDLQVNQIEELNDAQKDALGEIGNISMGTAATTLFTLLGQKVIITTPKVSISSIEELSSQYPKPFVAVDVKYKLGLKGANLLILKVEDVKVITDLMMGGDGTNIDRDINEMDLSAISEAMNQMVGSSCTSLSEMFTETIDIDPPRAFEINFIDDDIHTDMFNYKEPIVKVSFKIAVGNLIDSEIMQLIPLSFAKEMVSKLLGEEEGQVDTGERSGEDLIERPEPKETNHTEPIRQVDYQEEKREQVNRDIKRKKEQKQINVKKVDFQSFDEEEVVSYKESIELIKEVPIEVTVELGRTTRKISEILEYGPGTIIELDKLVGEPLDILANGKYIAKGEVVVIDDNFGIRITDIINPSKRISKL